MKMSTSVDISRTLIIVTRIKSKAILKEMRALPQN